MNKFINKNSFNQSLKRQEGIALLMSLIMLLLITVIGVSSVKLSLDDTKIAGNHIYERIVFQGAESGLNRTLSNSNLFHLQIPAADRMAINTLSNLPEEHVIGLGRIETEGSIKYERGLFGPKYDSVGNSSIIEYQVFTVTAESQLRGTSAKDTHTEGRALQKPKG